MSEPVVKRPTIDLDDFERRLRHASSNARDDDPLAELARLVGEPYDPYRDVFAQEATPAGGFPVDHQSHHDDAGRSEPQFDGAGAGSRLFGDFAAIEAGLRGGIQPHADPAVPSFGHHQQVSQQYEQAPPAHYGEPADAYGQTGFEPSWAEAQAPLTPRMRRPIYVMAATIAVGVIGIGAAFALKGHVSTSPSEIKTIMADAGPTKIQPPPEAASDAAGQDANVFGKGNQTAPTKLVNREEQPVDITQTVQDNAARAALMNPGLSLAGMTDASSVPVPPSPGQVQTAMADPQTGSMSRGDPIGDQVQGFGLSDMPAPKRVKVVSVRPDGTILPNDQPPAAAIPAPRQSSTKTSDHAAPVAKASTPKTATAKSTSRVTTTPRSIDSLAAGDDAAPAAKPANVKKTKPQRVASAETAPPETVAALSPTQSASSADANEAGAGGGFAVQLAAPGSEADAKSTSSRLSKKFADALGGRRLGFHKADSNGKSVYRVRVGSLSRSDAVSLCEKLKADGGTCFVAKN